MGRGSGTAKPTCSLSSTTTPGWCPVTGSASPKTPCAWPPRCARRWPPAVPRPGSTWTTAAHSVMRGCCGHARNSECGWCIRHQGRPQGRGKIERFFRTVREQFLVEVTDTSSEDLAAAGVDHATALLELNRLFVAWVETEYHRRVHTETGQSPLARWQAGWEPLGRTPAIPPATDLTEAFLLREWRNVTKTATVSLHANTYQVDSTLVGRKVELVFSPFDLETIEVRYRDKSYGKALPHTISRHAHPKAKPETPEPEPAAGTGIDYLALTAAAHHEQLRRDERIGYHALYGSSDDGQIPGQLSIDDLRPSVDVDHEGEVSA